VPEDLGTPVGLFGLEEPREGAEAGAGEPS
jgi:hypothetical protein